MKKILIMMLISVVVLVLVTGCGNNGQNNTNPEQTNQTQDSQEATVVHEENIESDQPVVTPQDEQSSYTPETAKEVTSVDINNMSQDDLDTLVNMFNDPNSTPEQKEAARIQLEQIFKQAEQVQQ